MTKEEAIDILRKMSEDNFYGNHVQEACRMGIEALSKRVLPAVLDEAAKDYCNSQPGWENKMDWAEEKDKEECRRDFKAGAEWNAAQGVQGIGVVSKLVDRAWVTPISPEDLEQQVFDNFVAGEKVIIQFLKKEAR